MFTESTTHATASTMTSLLSNPARSGSEKGEMPHADDAWRQVLARDASAAFLYAVTTTGVFCRPGCTSRRPRRENTRFFADAEAARAAGFRACHRCRPESADEKSSVARMCALLESRVDRRVSLAELGRLAGISPFTAQRRFTAAMGVSPSAYQRALRGHALRGSLQQGATVTEAIYEAGYGSSSRAYEAGALGMTPGRFMAGGKGETIGYAVAESPRASDGEELGWILIGATKRGLCWLSLAASAAEAEAQLRTEFPAAAIAADPELESALGEVIRGVSKADVRSAQLPLDLRGTAFQLRVWQALREIPRGETRTYSQLAREMGIPKSTRGVARACAMNRVSILVPCHRVVGVSGSLTGYRWGVDRKRKLLAGEKRS
jgi:AraC family transcriptional regulator, regulatory protein of adaptative response / methylated-DNA-[protein]-cysteine methyltransferase